MPGNGAWALVEPAATAVAPAHVRGRLFDTGLGYPAACFDDRDAADAVHGVVHGVVVTLREAQAARLLARLDRYEGPGYRRITVAIDGGEPAFAYDWIGPRAGLVELPSGRWPRPGTVGGDR